MSRRNSSDLISKRIENQIIHKCDSPFDAKAHVFSDISSRTTKHSNPACDAYSTSHFDYVMRIILLGDQGVGKTSFLKALKGHPDVKKLNCVCRVAQAMDHLEVEVMTCLGKKALVRLCDTGGQERYRSLTSSYYRGAQGALIMFDLKHQKSIDNVETWLSDLEMFSSSSSCLRILLGSNCSADDREVTSQTARKYADNRGLPYLEFDTSQSYNVAEVLEAVVDRIAKELTISPSFPQVIKPIIPTHNKRNVVVHKFVCLC